jgi:hypothetical protein
MKLRSAQVRIDQQSAAPELCERDRDFGRQSCAAFAGARTRNRYGAALLATDRNGLQPGPQRTDPLCPRVFRVFSEEHPSVGSRYLGHDRNLHDARVLSIEADAFTTRVAATRRLQVLPAHLRSTPQTLFGCTQRANEYDSLCHY